ncbi:putative ion transporter [Yamadazyma tenuis ATCC 10573]|uniref:Putative ion transporter n=1 Tax=Candida tenuis (strain ATCC 10573 / BCRC 21748 / CBS 615 / JCM 9827 / NBRC 10315 / NRRL Y-1498 / VKM Y-70) TaxID=590646 RepID=G3BFK3_CANTC|nr:putative ion transporter [Yamadazyma tenuis ATCC 10573]EGV60038.1 putative ion transporter [Yamadazyma tenuis ATCC 10573]
MLTDSDIVPGTVHLVDIEGTLHVKKDEHGNDKVILRPPPSKNINDPLRWSRMKKFKQFFMLFWLAVFLALAVAWSSPIWLIWTVDLNCTIQDLNNAMALTFLFLGLGCLFLQPTAMKLGRRFVYLMCCVLMMIAQIIGSQATSVHQIYGVFIITGFAAAPCDSLVEISTTDVFFQHERASFLALFILALYFGNYLGPAISGYIVDRLSWKWSYYLQLIMFGGTFIVLLFFMEDTTFRRREGDEEFEEEILGQIKSRETIGVEEEKDKTIHQVNEAASSSDSPDDDFSIDHSIPERGYWQKMKIIQTEYNDKRSWFKIWARPFLMLSFPAILWGGLIYGAQMMWLSLISTSQASLYGAPPYSFSSGTIGLFNFSPLVGNFIGMLYGGKFVDWLTIKLAERNKGIMEPEFRLYAMIVPTILNACGLLTYGLANANGDPWPVSVIIGIGFLGFSMSSTGAICLTYAIDSYHEMASEGMVMMLFIRNMIGMTFTFVFQYWLDRCGLVLLTWLLFMMALVINGSFVLLIIYGKRIRMYTKDRYLNAKQ